METTRVINGDVTSGRMVETEPPRERTDCVLCDGSGAERTEDGDATSSGEWTEWASGEGCRGLGDASEDEDGGGESDWDVIAKS